MTEADTAVAVLEAPRPEKASYDSIEVLLLEDNPGDARLVELMLRESGRRFHLQRVERLEDALEQLHNGDFGLVLADLTLPDSSGLETFTRIHAHAPHVPVIVMSGLADESMAVQAVQDGAQDYFVKGQVDGQLLSRAMRYAIERNRMAAQLARYAGELRERNAQMEADFNMAREIQEVFLPQRYPTFPPSVAPEQSALRFFHRYEPAAAVGGDFFSIFPITDSTAGIIICDVMGHGMRAALVTAIMRGLVEQLMPVAADPGKFLGEINHSIHTILRRTDEPFLSTAFYLIADVTSGELRFASAGHPSPLIIRRDRGMAEQLKFCDPRHGPALGLYDVVQYPVCRTTIAPNDLIVLFTDGLYEMSNVRGEEFGIERLMRSVRQRIHLPAVTLFDELLHEVRHFAATPDFDDDVCLVGVEVSRTGRSG